MCDSCVCVCVCLVVAHDSTDPAVVAAHSGIDAGVSFHGAVITPGHHSLQLTITHQRTTRVSLHTQTEEEQQWSESVYFTFYDHSETVTQNINIDSCIPPTEQII